MILGGYVDVDLYVDVDVDVGADGMGTHVMCV